MPVAPIEAPRLVGTEPNTEMAQACLLAFMRRAVEQDEGTEPWTDWHVMFKCGTVCRLRSLTDVAEFEGYDDSYSFPEHRIQDGGPGAELFRGANQRLWEAQRDTPGDPGLALRGAYHQLIRDGYPHPGTDQSDRFAVELEEPDAPNVASLVVWPNSDLDVMNIVVTTDSNSAVVVGGDYRRYDYMEPEVIAIISPALEVVRPARAPDVP
jgi:hypothetical protein